TPLRVLRGGVWRLNRASWVRGAYRNLYGASYRYNIVGFRCGALQRHGEATLATLGDPERTRDGATGQERQRARGAAGGNP
ncbi:MAG: hypothetical protein WCI05_13255, partial [Myxococcales bacterium]